MPDSALHYYHLAEPEFKRLLSTANLQLIYSDMAECYHSLDQPEAAIRLFEQSLQISRNMKNFQAISEISFALSRLYADGGNFRRAYDYNLQYQDYQDSLQALGTQRELALMEMERETLQHQKDLAEAARQKLNERNLQYMSISIAILCIFFFMIIVGAFPVSRFTIKMLGYISFICLFEFIVLLLDAFLHRVTHGEPLKIWILKVIIIAMMVPFQHFLEHGMTRFLQSRKLIRLRTHFSLRKWWAGLNKPKRSRVRRKDFEEDTAVL
jgi:tetratricopeptide (TPR) repeat protein